MGIARPARKLLHTLRGGQRYPISTHDNPGPQSSIINPEYQAHRDRLMNEDVRQHYGSTSTIVAEHFTDSGLDLRKRVATVLFFGIKTDTHGLSRRTTRFDLQAYARLAFSIDRYMLSEIGNPPVPREHVPALRRALKAHRRNRIFAGENRKTK